MQFYIVDVFAEAPFAGNQLAVFRGAPDDDTMQALAREMNYSETTFITSDTPHNGGYDVRIFTPNQELPFAGHPTLGTAFIIWQELLDGAGKHITLNEKVGPIPVEISDEGYFWMQQNPPQFGHEYTAGEMAVALNLSVDDIDTRYPVQEVSTGLPFIIVPLKTLDACKRAKINDVQFLQMLAPPQSDGVLGAQAVFVFSPEAQAAENDLHARCFVGVLAGPAEDPATGSANGCFAGYLIEHNYFHSPHIQKRVEQGYEIGRPSLILLDAQREPERISVRVGGRVQMMARGEFPRL